MFVVFDVSSIILVDTSVASVVVVSVEYANNVKDSEVVVVVVVLESIVSKIEVSTMTLVDFKVETSASVKDMIEVAVADSVSDSVIVVPVNVVVVVNKVSVADTVCVYE